MKRGITVLAGFVLMTFVGCAGGPTLEEFLDMESNVADSLDLTVRLRLLQDISLLVVGEMGEGDTSLVDVSFHPSERNERPALFRASLDEDLLFDGDSIATPLRFMDLKKI